MLGRRPVRSIGDRGCSISAPVDSKEAVRASADGLLLRVAHLRGLNIALLAAWAVLATLAVINNFDPGPYVVWPLAARAQHGERMRRIGVLAYWAADDAEGLARLAAFAESLKQLGWNDGRNLQLDTRWAPAYAIGRHAAELEDASSPRRSAEEGPPRLLSRVQVAGMQRRA